MKKRRIFLPCMIVLLVLQLCAVFWICGQKQGFHYDEYYSYYSSNVTYALVPTDMEWKDTAEIRSEFMVLPDGKAGYGMVKLMQSLDVHPPLYYYLLHTVCLLSKGVFSKWQGLSINIFFFILSWITLAAITKEITGNDKKKIFAVCTLFGFSPAIFSGITFIRMYMMLTFLCLLILYVHIRAIMKGQRTIMGFYLPIALLAFLGFHTHYYFAVFLFFLAAAKTLYLFFNKATRKASFVYAGSVLVGLGLSVLAYPSCLRHIFRGYRGTEAQEAFFDLGNLGERLGFFYQLTNEYAFGNMLLWLILVILLLVITNQTLKKMSRIYPKLESIVKVKEEKKPWSPRKKAIALTMVTTVGYFCVVAKTALLNAEEAIRYEMPIYGLLILLVLLLLEYMIPAFHGNKNDKWTSYLYTGLVLLVLIGQVRGLAAGKVCFLYPEDAKNVAWAANNHSQPVAYIYNTGNQWMIWDESEELMQYDKIYFISSEQQEVKKDELLSAAERIYLYKMRGKEADKVFNKLIEENGGFQNIKLVRELLYCDLYELER